MRLALIFLASIPIMVDAAEEGSPTNPGTVVFDIDELADREIASGARISLQFKSPIDSLSARFKSCVPVESKEFKGYWESGLDSQIFTSKELADLDDCDLRGCAFNFLPDEIEQLDKTQTEADRVKLFKSFYHDRFLGKRSLDPNRAKHLIKSSERPFTICNSNHLNQLLDKRPLNTWPFRISVAHYNPRMRPTTRLLQGDFFNSESGDLCFADVFVYSNHYDLDRAEIWRLKKVAPLQVDLELQVRHRIDLLNTWFRRLNKGSLRDELRQLLEQQIRQAASCLSSPPPSGTLK